MLSCYYFLLHFFFQNKSPANNASSSSTVSSTSVAGTESTQDFFTVMLYTHMTDEALVVGARNILYKLSVDELRLKQTLTWNSVELDRDSCLVKGKVAPYVFTRFLFGRQKLISTFGFCHIRFDANLCQNCKEIFQ